MLRITSGEFKGRMIRTVDTQATRPTQSRLRQAWVNAWQMRLPGARVLDIFAGSGALGFEALSRGAAHCVFIEKSPQAVRVIEENARELDVVQKVTVLGGDAQKMLPRVLLEAPYDLVFMDPPYDLGLDRSLLEGWPWKELIGENSQVGVEASYDPSGPFQVNHFRVVRDQRYGATRLTMYARNGESS
jgi:16S rRNA (guanine966-N2)-methyltransferase